ncbi:MAG: protein kinase [Nanoarchaeota archaeon]|nr:protein kinase [Nanoarchaeota archaeon]
MPYPIIDEKIDEPTLKQFASQAENLEERLQNLVKSNIEQNQPINFYEGFISACTTSSGLYQSLGLGVKDYIDRFIVIIAKEIINSTQNKSEKINSSGKKINFINKELILKHSNSFTNIHPNFIKESYKIFNGGKQIKFYEGLVYGYLTTQALNIHYKDDEFDYILKSFIAIGSNEIMKLKRRDTIVNQILTPCNLKKSNHEDFKEQKDYLIQNSDVNLDTLSKLIKNKTTDSKLQDIIDCAEQDIPDEIIQIKKGQGENFKTYEIINEHNKKLKRACKVYSPSNKAKELFENNGINLVSLIQKQTAISHLSGKAHRYACQIYDIKKNGKGELIIIEELFDHSLNQEVSLGKTLDTQTILKYAYQLTKVLSYYHKKGIYHSDIKLENIGILNKEIRLTDWGASGKIKKIKNEILGNQGYEFGSIDTKDPRLYNLNNPDAQSDIWSTICVIYRLAKGYYPFSSKKRKPRLDDANRNEYVNKVKENATDSNYLNDSVFAQIGTLPNNLARILQKGFQRKYSTCEELSYELKLFQ